MTTIILMMTRKEKDFMIRSHFFFPLTFYSFLSLEKRRICFLLLTYANQVSFSPSHIFVFRTIEMLSSSSLSFNSSHFTLSKRRDLPLSRFAFVRVKVLPIHGYFLFSILPLSKFPVQWTEDRKGKLKLDSSI